MTPVHLSDKIPRMKQYNIQPIQSALETAKTVLILLPQNPSLDAVAAGLSLYLSFSDQQLKTTIGCSTPMTVNFNRLFGVDKIKPRIGNQNLVVSFQYPEDSLEKVSYDKDPKNQKFHLTIEPKAGFSPLDPQSVEYSYTGSNADIIFVVGTKAIEDLGPIYEQEKTLLDNPEKTIVNLSNLDKNSQFGSVNLYDPTSAGCSEIALILLKNLNLNLNPDIATNLLAGIESATNNLAQTSSPETYEVVAELIRLGAKKGYIPLTTSTTQTSFGSTPRPTNPFTQRPPRQTQSWPLPNNNPQPLPSVTPQPQPLPSAAPQPDWLKPKVLTSSSTKI